nr:DNA/RNA non-specific endonuclease [Tumebacillus amylolyticus]
MQALRLADSYNLRYSAHQFIAGADAMRGLAKRYSDSAQNLLHYWKGQAAQNFSHVHEQMAVDLQKLADALERTGSELQTLASRNDHIQELKRQAQQVEWQLEYLDSSDPHYGSQASSIRQRAHDLYYAAEMEARVAEERAVSAFREIESVTNSLFVTAVHFHQPVNSALKERHWWEKAMDFLSGAVYSVAASESWGLLELAVDDDADLRSDEYVEGKIFGDYLSTGLGVVTAIDGLLVAAGGAVGGALFSWTGVGLVAGAGISVVGVAESAYGAGVAVKGYTNLQNDKAMMEARRSESKPSSTGDSTPKPSKPSEETFEDVPFDESGNLKPNIQYRAGEYDYFYETDELGRLSKFEAGDLQLTKRENRLDHNPNTPGKKEGDHAGHLAGDRFGGSPELDNLVSQSSSVNLSQYKRLENQWANAIKDGKQVKVNVLVEYTEDNVRPSRFKVQYEIDGDYFEKMIIN